MIEFQRDAFSVFTGCMEFQYGAKESTAPGDSFVWTRFPWMARLHRVRAPEAEERTSPPRWPRLFDGRMGGRSTAVVWILGAFYFFFSLFLFFRDRAALMKSGHEWTIDSVHVAGGNFSPKCRAYEYGYFESVVREIRRCNWKRRMFSEVCFFFLFFCISFFFFFSVDYLVAFREIIVRFEDSRRDCYLDCV